MSPPKAIATHHARRPAAGRFIVFLRGYSDVELLAAPSDAVCGVRVATVCSPQIWHKQNVSKPPIESLDRAARAGAIVPLPSVGFDHIEGSGRSCTPVISGADDACETWQEEWAKEDDVGSGARRKHDCRR